MKYKYEHCSIGTYQPIDEKRLIKGETYEQQFIDYWAKNPVPDIFISSAKLGDYDESKAPYTYFSDGTKIQSPDLQLSINGRTVAAEVKSKQKFYQQWTQNGLEYVNYIDIHRVKGHELWQQKTGLTVYYILYVEDSSGHPDPDPDNWYICSLNKVLSDFIEVRPEKDRKSKDAFVIGAETFTPLHKFLRAQSKQQPFVYTPPIFYTTAAPYEFTPV